MKILSYLNETSDLTLFKEAEISEVILAPKALSRKGKLGFVELQVLAQKAKELGFDTILEWDVIATQNDFEVQEEFFKKLDLSYFDTIRMQDPGVLEYVMESTTKKIHWITEHGNHNLSGLMKWESYIGQRLTRLVISSELSFLKIQKYSKSLKCPLEILILGKILLFYTPRALLGESDQAAHADSEESPHKGFFVEQNRHGTFMYHLKDLCLLNESQKLSELSHVYGRIEMSYLGDKKGSAFLSALKLLNDYSTEAWDDFKEMYPVGLTKGFFLTNKTDVIFPKLKNYRLLRSDDCYVGEVADVLKGKYVIVAQKSHTNLLSVGDSVECFTPEGKTLSFQVSEIKTLGGVSLERAPAGELVMIPYKKAVVSKSVLTKVLS